MKCTVFRLLMDYERLSKGNMSFDISIGLEKPSQTSLLLTSRSQVTHVRATRNEAFAQHAGAPVARFINTQLSTAQSADLKFTACMLNVRA